MKITRTAYYAMYRKREQPYPLFSGVRFKTLYAAQGEARKLAQQGYCGWIMRIREMREDYWPEDYWQIDYSVDDAITQLEQF